MLRREKSGKRFLLEKCSLLSTINSKNLSEFCIVHFTLSWIASKHPKCDPMIQWELFNVTFTCAIFKLTNMQSNFRRKKPSPFLFENFGQIRVRKFSLKTFRFEIHHDKVGYVPNDSDPTEQRKTYCRLGAFRNMLSIIRCKRFCKNSPTAFFRNESASWTFVSKILPHFHFRNHVNWYSEVLMKLVLLSHYCWNEGPNFSSIIS